MKRISIIVAIAKNNAIGKNNELLWHIPADMKWFKKITAGHQVIMGKLTWESLPLKPLPNRKNVVITDKAGETIEGCTTVYSIEQALNLCNEHEESFIIGGGSIYRQFLPYSNKLYITLVNKEFDADIFFPEINREEWELVEREDIDHDATLGFSYSFLTFERILKK